MSHMLFITYLNVAGQEMALAEYILIGYSIIAAMLTSMNAMMSPSRLIQFALMAQIVITGWEAARVRHGCPPTGQ